MNTLTQQQNDFIQKCKEKKLYPAIIMQVQRELSKGMSIQEVKLFASNSNEWSDRVNIRRCINLKLKTSFIKQIIARCRRQAKAKPRIYNSIWTVQGVITYLQKHNLMDSIDDVQSLQSLLILNGEQQSA